MKDNRQIIYTDGACSGNPGPGGWAVLIRHPNGSVQEMTGGTGCTTNNAMEITAAIVGLESTTGPVTIYTDSQYLINGITKWLPQWVRSGWRTSTKDPVKNRELWEKLSRLVHNRPVAWLWVRGHDGHPENERCDALATASANAQRYAPQPVKPLTDLTPRLVKRAK